MQHGQKEKKILPTKVSMCLSKADFHPNPNVDTIIFPRPINDALDHVTALTKGHYLLTE